MTAARRALVAVALLVACRRGAPNDPGIVKAAPDAAVQDAGGASSSPNASAIADAGKTATAAPEAGSEWTVPAIVVDGAAAYWFASAREVVTQRPSGEGTPAPFAKAEHQPLALALDAKRVYWIEDSGELIAATRADGSKHAIAKLEHPRGLVVDAASALVVADDGEQTAAVYRVPLSGGASQKLAAVPPSAMTLAADDQSIFVVTTEVLRVPKTGGAAKKVSDSPEEAQSIVLVGDDIVFIGSDPQATIGRVWKMPKRGRAPEKTTDSNTMTMYAGAVPLSGEEGTVTALASDGRRPFWISSAIDPDAKDAALQWRRSPKGEPAELAKVPATSGLAVYRSRIYWSTAGGVRSLPVPP